MLLLDTTSKSLIVALGTTVTTNQLPFTASYVDIGTAAFTPGANDGTTNNASDVTMISSPGTGLQRQVKEFTIQNADTASAVVKVSLKDVSTEYTVLDFTLNPGDTLQYVDAAGLFCLDNAGNLKQIASYPVANAHTILGNSLGSVAAPTNLTLGTHLTFSGTNVVMDVSGVSAGTYGGTAATPVLTIDAQGVITTATTVPPKISINATANGTLNNNQTVFYCPVSIAFIIGSTAPNSYYTSVSSGSTTQQFYIQKNSSTFGTVNVGTTGIGTLAGFATDTSFAIGDKFGIVLNGTADLGLISPAFSFQGTKN